MNHMAMDVLRILSILKNFKDGYIFKLYSFKIKWLFYFTIWIWYQIPIVIAGIWVWQCYHNILSTIITNSLEYRDWFTKESHNQGV